MPARVIRSAARRLAEGVDRAFASTALSPSQRVRGRSSAESLGHEERIEGLALLERFYNQTHHDDPDGPFFGRPEPIAPTVTRVRGFGRNGEVLDLRWPSVLGRAATDAAPRGDAMLAAMDPPPRYQPARALPERAYVPGQGAPPLRAGEASAAEHLPDSRWAEHAEYLWGVDLYNAGLFWEAHEAWEGVWRLAAPDPVQHAFLQGLIQCAAACLKGMMGDAESARRLADRALGRLARVRAERGDLYMGVDLAELVPAFRAFAREAPTLVAQRPRLVLVALHAGDEMPLASLPIDGVLDLHTFRPTEAGEVVQSYLDACQARGIFEVRIIHGKGKGTLRRTVQAVLERRADVLAHGLAPPERGGWGATLVTLKPAAGPQRGA